MLENIDGDDNKIDIYGNISLLEQLKDGNQICPPCWEKLFSITRIPIDATHDEIEAEGEETFLNDS